MNPILTALAMGDGGQVVTLSGSSGTPNQATADNTSPTSSTAGWKFQTSGQLQRTTGTGAYANFQAGVQWCNRPASLYIRATLDSGNAPDNGPTLNTWVITTTEREWTWDRSAVGTNSGTLQIDIATDSGGTDIIATGYYQGSATVDSGV